MVKNMPAVQETYVPSLVQKDPLKKEMATTPVFLPGEFHGQRSLVGYGPWGSQKVVHDKQLTLSLFTFFMLYFLICLSSKNNKIENDTTQRSSIACPQ